MGLSYPVWVELPNLPIHLAPWIKTILSPLGHVLGNRPVTDYNPAWHPQVLVELDLSQPLPDQIAIDCVECSIIQPILYKHLPNSCFHYGKQGHIIRNCPIKNPQIILPQANEKSQANTVNS